VIGGIDRYIAEIIPQKKAGAVQVFQLRQWQSELGQLTARWPTRFRAAASACF
jgi:hypothetical protein